MPGLCGKLDDLLADDVVRMTDKPCLVPGQPLEHPPETPGWMLCLFPLQLGTNERIAIVKMPHIPPHRRSAGVVHR